MEKNLYVTTPIYYVNGDPHLGHAHTSVVADIIKRMMVMQGSRVFLTTGVDEHGQKNQEEIIKRGMTTGEYLDMQGDKFKGLFDSLSVSYDYFVRTTSGTHKAAVVEALSILFQRGFIEKKKYTGLYCKGCEQFKTAADLDEAGRCPDHKTKPVLEQEANYFFKLEPYRDWLVGYIHNHPSWIQPEIYRNKVIDMLKEPLEDLCISRPVSRVSLGIPLPFDPDYVAYVWFDALLNYISNIGWGKEETAFDALWKNSYHLMAKDIIKTHCIYWPIMLKALDIEPVTSNLVHGFWVGGDGRKMSKSLGNGIDPVQIVAKYGSDCLRLFLAAKLGRTEAKISEELVAEFYSAVMVNIFGNTHLRVCSLLGKFADGRIPPVANPDIKENNFLNEAVRASKASLPQSPEMEAVQYSANSVIELGRSINRYIDASAPWSLAKDPANETKLRNVLRTACEAVRLLFVAAYPFMPQTSVRVLECFGLSEYPRQGQTEAEDGCFILTEDFRISEVPVLFPKIMKQR